MKKLLFTIALSAFAVSAFAQEFRTTFDETSGTFERITKRGPYLTNRLFDNMFIGVAGGVNLYMGKHDSDAGFGDRLAPAIDVSLGKWITPHVGLRLQYSGLSAKGAARRLGGYATGAQINRKYYEKEFDLMNFHGDILWNISNSIGGYKESRFWDFVPFIGAGVAHSDGNGKKATEFAVSGGLLSVIRLGKVIDLTLEARGMCVKNDFDKYKEGGKRPDLMGSVTAGLSFNLGPKDGMKRPLAVAPADYTPYNQRINALEGDLSSANERISRLQKQLDDCNNRPEPKPVTITTPTTMAVFFEIGQTTIKDTEMVNVQNIAKAIQASSDKTFTVVGYADAGTGSAKRNQVLSQQRAQAVADALQKLGVNASQLRIEGKGGVSTHKNPSVDRMVRIE